jgi:hypothetical protein
MIWLVSNSDDRHTEPRRATGRPTEWSSPALRAFSLLLSGSSALKSFSPQFTLSTFESELVYINLKDVSVNIFFDKVSIRKFHQRFHLADFILRHQVCALP